MALSEPTKKLILHIEVSGLWADDLEESASYLSDPEPPGPDDLLCIVTEEWMRPDVGLTIVTIPGDKCMNDDSLVKSFDARIVGAELRDIGGQI